MPGTQTIQNLVSARHSCNTLTKQKGLEMVHMGYLIIGLSLYLMYYTFSLARTIWKEGNKFAGFIITIMATCFPVLSIILKLK
ncbi:Uncharacterised protein [Lederbergia lenta]|uniref:Uncharacterized protein n=1 Tax=Lederbergia lenta TaxID=1467 RepID=A0A2X4VXC8_LEDLE|nr:Uncharacterised protein [Lederbergia lenta]